MEDTSAGLGPPPRADNPSPGIGPPPGDRCPQSLWQAYQLAEQWCWDCWKELDSGPPIPRRSTDPDPGGSWKPEAIPYKKTALRLHSSLPKAHSSLLTQIRTGKIGLAGFLHKCRVPTFELLACACGWQWETAKHIIVDCPHFSREHVQLRQAAASTEFQRLTSDPRAAAALTMWFIQLNLLPQFSWAQEQLPSA